MLPTVQLTKLNGFILIEHEMWGHDKMRSRADLWGGSPLVSFNHVIDPHFVTFSSSCIQQSATPTLTIFLTVTLQ